MTPRLPTSELWLPGVEGLRSMAASIIDNLGGSLTIGVTDASVIDASGATVNPDGDGGLFMENPDSNTITLTVTGASGSGIYNELQGSLGPIQAGSSVGDGTISTVNDINDTAFVGQGGPATINGGTDAGDYIFDTGGPETINLNNASGTDHVEYSMFDWNSDGYPFFALAITDDHGNYSGFDGQSAVRVWQRSTASLLLGPPLITCPSTRSRGVLVSRQPSVPAPTRG